MTSSSSSYRKKVYTKFGDLGETSLLYGGRISKNDLHTEAYGITDEAVSAMGLARATTDDLRVKDVLRDLQRELFTIAAELATELGYHHVFASGMDSEGFGFGNALLSRWPIARSESTMLHENGEGRLAVFAEVDGPRGPLPLSLIHI